jgi:hypothetical protein
LKDPQNAFGQLTQADITLRAPIVLCHWITETDRLEIKFVQGQMYLHMSPSHLQLDLRAFVFDTMDDLRGEQEDVVVAILDIVFSPPANEDYININVLL